ncbi:signal peptidase I [Thiobacillus sp.]|uniref:signal peptidase I n=1 Tax=Thiobacillus sp. TaxID=924 RepID=UPI0025CB97AE|nr:signal peptidase I [Thiobacillus sp.]MBT9540143.1 signal peptidase I [Thiobacillus sp.]
MSRWLKSNRAFLAFLLCFGFFRLAIADWNPIPSGSMRPTLLEGDVVLVNRLAYDFKLPLSDISVAHIANPKHGDVVVFTSPKDGMRLIKRLVGVPGDVIEMQRDVLFINGSPAQYTLPEVVAEPTAHDATTPGIRVTEQIAEQQRTVQFLPHAVAMRDFGPVTVPPDHYFFLGDNRDNSADSRYIGFVPRDHLIGRAHHILVSANIKGNWLPRIERIGERIQ